MTLLKFDEWLLVNSVTLCFKVFSGESATLLKCFKVVNRICDTAKMLTSVYSLTLLKCRTVIVESFKLMFTTVLHEIFYIVKMLTLVSRIFEHDRLTVDDNSNS